MVQDLVNQIQGAGCWLDQTAGESQQGGGRSPSGKNFFNQDPKILQFVMENPTDRVTYGDLRMIREEFEDLMQLSIEAGTIKHPIAVRKVHRRQLRARDARPRPSRCDTLATLLAAHCC